MINMNFWKRIKEKWIRDEDPTIEATSGSIQKDERSTEEINKLNQMLNGGISSSGQGGSLDDLNRMMEQLNDLGLEDSPFDDMFSNVGDEE